MFIHVVVLFIFILLLCIIQAQWMQVIDDLFLPDKPFFMFKRPGNLYDFKKKVVAGMQARHRKVTGRGTHSTSANPDDHEDVSVVDRLTEKLYNEMKLVQDRKKASHQESELLKAAKKSTSNLLVRPPPPDVPCVLIDATQQSAATHNPLSVLTGAIANNNVPNLDDEVTATVTGTSSKRQRLTNNDCGDAISKFVASSSDLFGSFSTYVENKAKADSRCFSIQLLNKLEKGIITQQQFELMKPSDF